MQESGDVLYKPNKTIMITNKDITVNQRKAYNVVLHKAWNDLKINKNQTIFKFNISELKRKAGIKANDNWHLKKDMEDISDIKVENVKENGDWCIFRLISSARKNGDFLEIELPAPIREELIINNYYTALDLLQIQRLEGKHAVPIYEMAIRFKKKQIPEMTIDELRLLTGTNEKPSYNNFNLFKNRVLTPALKEINDKTDILLDYTTTTQGKKTVTIKFTVTLKESAEPIELMPGQLTIEDALKDTVEKIVEPLGVDPKLIKNFDIDIELLKQQVEAILKNKKYAKTIPGALKYSVQMKLKPEDIESMLRATSRRKPSNRDFDEREYSEDYYNNFFTNQKGVG